MLYRDHDSLILRTVISAVVVFGLKPIIRLSMAHSNAAASALVSNNLSLLSALELDSAVLDLACGSGRHGKLLLEHNIPVIFADRDAAALAEIELALQHKRGKFQTWKVDLEQTNQNPLADRLFDAVLVFNYLHRPLMNDIGRAIKAGGWLFYETFTTAQRNFGRPSNPDFLLQPGELRDYFAGWDIEFYFEGEYENPQRAMASLIARKPE